MDNSQETNPWPTDEALGPRPGVGSPETIWEAPIVQLIVEDIVLSPVKACE
jgi:hypothetical protein